MKVTAYNVKTKTQEEIVPLRVLKMKTDKGKFRYRIAGTSRDGDRMSKFVSADDAKKYAKHFKIKIELVHTKNGKKRTCDDIGIAAKERCAKNRNNRKNIKNGSHE